MGWLSEPGGHVSVVSAVLLSGGSFASAPSKQKLDLVETDQKIKLSTAVLTVSQRDPAAQDPLRLRRAEG